MTVVAHGGAGALGALPFLALGGVLAAYLWAARRQRLGGRRWSGWRIASFATGVALLAVAFAPGVDARAADDFRVHVAQHLLVGMFAPIALVLAAPATLVLRTLPRSPRRRVAPVLRSRALRVLTHPAPVVLLDMGALYVLYLTPLYGASLTSTPLHVLVHVHVLAAGYLFAWVIAGRDPAPHRPGLRTRLVALVAAAAAHAVLAKLLYADGLPAGAPHPLTQVEQGAQLMYYGGDVAEVLLAVALFTAWLGARTRADARRAAGHRRPACAPAAPAPPVAPPLTRGPCYSARLTSMVSVWLPFARTATPASTRRPGTPHA